VVDLGSIPGRITKDYKICICCFSAKHAVLGSKNKDWLARNQNTVWSDMSTRRLLFQWASTIKIQLGVLVKSKVGIIISSKYKFLPHDIAEKCFFVDMTTFFPIGYNNYPANRFINTSSSSWKSVDESYIKWETNTMYPRVTISRPVIG
jgi:hypothetical protein